jgi:beta-1,4-mannosyl-glycoprotein beta-1,4-N-acetylglucosaminyltransferase
MKIFDVFPFMNELDLLEIRLHELYDVVDFFVLAEATRTHTGIYKPLYYKMNRTRFHKFQDKIIHVIVDDMPVEIEDIKRAHSKVNGWVEGDIQGDNWTRERYQRDSMQTVLDKMCSPDDIIILEDADEIVRTTTIEIYNEMVNSGLASVGQSLHSYYLNWLCTNMPWSGTKIFRYKNMTTLSENRFHTEPIMYIGNGGWHFSFMGGTESIRQKIYAYVHQEFAQPEVIDNLGNRLKEGKDALGRLYQYKIVEIDETYPKYIKENPDKFKDWIYVS